MGPEADRHSLGNTRDISTPSQPGTALNACIREYTVLKPFAVSVFQSACFSHVTQLRPRAFSVFISFSAFAGLSTAARVVIDRAHVAVRSIHLHQLKSLATALHYSVISSANIFPSTPTTRWFCCDSSAVARAGVVSPAAFYSLH